MVRRRSRCTASFAAFRVAATTIIRNISRDVSIVLVLRRSRRLVARPVAVAAMAAPAAAAAAAASALAFTSKRADAGKEPPAHIATSRQTADANRSASFLPPAAAAPAAPVPRSIRVRHWSLHRRHCLLQAVALHTGSEVAVTKDPLALISTSVLVMMLTPLLIPSQHQNQPRPHLRRRTISSSRFC